MKSDYRVCLSVWIGTGVALYHLTVSAQDREHALTEAKRRATNDGMYVINPVSAKLVETAHV